MIEHSVLQEAIDSVSNLNKQYRAVFKVSEALAKIGNLVQAENEYRAARDKANSEREKAEAALLEVNGRVNAAQEKLADLQDEIDRAENVIADTVAIANEKAAKIVTDAEAKADKIFSDTQKMSQQLSREISRDRAAFEKSKAAWAGEQAKAEKRLADTKAEINAILNRIKG